MTANAQTALVTGASTGIGATYADRLARRGFNLVLVARNTGRLEALRDRLATETGVEIEILTADLTVAGDTARVAARLAEPDITLLVNNAGMALNGSLADVPADAIGSITQLNVVAPTLLAQAAAKSFLARGRGAIINLASVLALAPEMFDPVYSGTKAFILALSQGLAAQYADRGVRIQAVLPGATRTEIWERSGKDVDAFPDDFVMAVGDLVDAALVGFDRGEAVTIPPLADEGQWQAFEAARKAMAPGLSRSRPAERYLERAGA